MLDRKRSAVDWIDVVSLLFILGLAFLPPINEIHKQLTLLAIGVFQFLEGKLIAWLPGRGRSYSMLIKIGLATLLLDHTGEAGINSSYYPIYYLPVVTAAIYFGPIATLGWTALTSLAYCLFLIPAIYIEDYELTAEGAYFLAIRILFFFLAAMVVNRFAVENRRQVARYQALSHTLEETNRQLQRAEADARRSERLAALGQLSAGLAHEIRNPLGVIKGSAEMLTEKLKDAQPLVSELAGYISSEVNRLNALVARFLDFARPSSLDLHPQQLPAIVDRALDSVLAQAPDRNVRVERHYAPSLPEALADEQLCERIFVNLIQNAYQAMQELTGDSARVLCLSIAAENSNGRGGVGVTIQDTGPGVPAAAREQIFNPFFTSKKDGVGLGLAIVAKIVDDHRGWIRLEGDSSPGARFHLFFPSAQA
ncbi:MAG TPA: ATP-binding protein [Candidatus Acidoferrales bacterium]|nr:ATP-binding protein [Candidatus Acidoferrales bacterium]